MRAHEDKYGLLGAQAPGTPERLCTGVHLTEFTRKSHRLDFKLVYGPWTSIYQC